MDVTYLANHNEIITQHHFISRWGVEASTILAIMTPAHVALVFVFLIIALFSVIDLELRAKSDLTYHLYTRPSLFTEPIDDFLGRVNRTTKSMLRHVLDFFGFLILLSTLVLLFGKGR